MKSPLALVFFLHAALLTSFSALAQDVQVRQEAEQLMERAQAASAATGGLPNFERTENFQVFGPDGTQEGSFSRVAIRGTGQRDEMTLGSFHWVGVLRNRQLSTSGNKGMAPAEF